MTTSTQTLTLTGFLGRDVETRLTTPRDYRRTTYDPVIDGDVVCEGTTPVRELAQLSLAVHEGGGCRPHPPPQLVATISGGQPLLLPHPAASRSHPDYADCPEPPREVFAFPRLSPQHRQLGFRLHGMDRPGVQPPGAVFPSAHVEPRRPWSDHALEDLPIELSLRLRTLQSDLFAVW